MFHLLSAVPHGLGTLFAGVWTSRQSTNPLAHPQLLLVVMSQDVNRFVQGCTTCTISMSPCHLPEGKLQLLPIPHQPWPHLGVDFITDLPASD